MKIRSVSELLLKPINDKLTIKLKVDLTDSRKDVDSFYSIFESSGASYLTFFPNAYITFQYKTVGAYDPNQIIKIYESDIFQVIREFKKFYQKLLRPDLFIYYKSGAITCEPRRDDVVTVAIKTGGYIQLEPAVIADNRTNQPLPGVRLSLNIKENLTELSIDEYEMIMYKLSTININSEGMNLINSYMLLESRIERNRYGDRNNNQLIGKVMNDKPRQPKINIFQRKEELDKLKEEQDEIVIDTRVVNNTPTSLNEVM